MDEITVPMRAAGIAAYEAFTSTHYIGNTKEIDDLVCAVYAAMDAKSREQAAYSNAV